MEYLGFDVGFGWWEPAASKMPPLQDMQIRDVPKKGPHEVYWCVEFLPAPHTQFHLFINPS